MNILPFIIAILLVLALSVKSFFHQATTTRIEQSEYLSYMGASRDTLDALELQAKQNEAKSSVGIGAIEDEEDDEVDATDKIVKPFKNVHLNPAKKEHSHSRLNISRLFQEGVGAEKSVLYGAAKRLIRNTYANAPFFQDAKIENLEGAILDAMIKEAKQKESVRTLIDLCPADGPLREVIYKMLRGTKHCQHAFTRGYPPLEDVFRVDNSGKAASLYFFYATDEMLKAYFGEDITEQIYALEYKQWKESGKNGVLKRPDLDKLLNSLSPSHPPFGQTSKALISGAKIKSDRGAIGKNEKVQVHSVK